MRKSKFYFGRNKGYDSFGRKAGKQSVIRMLRKYFDYRLQLWLMSEAKKFEANGSYGAIGGYGSHDKHYVPVNAAHAHEQLIERREIKRKMLSGSF